MLMMGAQGLSVSENRSQWVNYLNKEWNYDYMDSYRYANQYSVYDLTDFKDKVKRAHDGGDSWSQSWNFATKNAKTFEEAEKQRAKREAEQRRLQKEREEIRRKQWLQHAQDYLWLSGSRAYNYAENHKHISTGYIEDSEKLYRYNYLRLNMRTPESVRNVENEMFRDMTKINRVVRWVNRYDQVNQKTQGWSQKAYDDANAYVKWYDHAEYDLMFFTSKARRDYADKMTRKQMGVKKIDLWKKEWESLPWYKKLPFMGARMKIEEKVMRK